MEDIMATDSTGPSIEVLRTRVLLADTGEVAAVARKLGLDESVISRRLRSLREQYQLVQGREPSAKGMALLPAVRDLLRCYDQLVQGLKDQTSRLHLLYVGTGSYGARHYLPDLEGVSATATARPDWDDGRPGSGVRKGGGQKGGLPGWNLVAGFARIQR
jgi:hypothetical protein